MSSCSNCEAPLKADFKVCPNCGQKTHLHRFTLGHIFHEIFHAVTHTDKGILYLIKHMTLYPGVAAREYVLENKRKRYFNPFTFLILVLGLTVFTNSIFHPYSKRIQDVSNEFKTEKKKQKYNKILQRQKEAIHFIESRNNLVTFMALPIIAFIFWLFFRKTGVNYAEHLVANIFFAVSNCPACGLTMCINSLKASVLPSNASKEMAANKSACSEILFACIRQYTA